MREGASKSLALAGGILVVMAMLCAYVAWLQLVRGTENDANVRRQQDRLTYIPAERGTILDRNGVVLDKSVPEYHIALRIEKIRDPRDTRRRTIDKASTVISSLAAFLGPDYYRTRPGREAMLKHITSKAPMPFVLWTSVPQEDIRRWAAHREDYPGTELYMTWRRHHSHADSACLVRGDTALGTPANPLKVRNVSFAFREMKGVSGMEAAMDAELRGSGGLEFFQTDVQSYRNATFDMISAQRGKDIRLTIDIELQEYIEAQFRENAYKGALLLMDLRNGDILASVSEPTVKFGEPASKEQEGALFNRALAGYYPPGSAFKPLLALTALDCGMLTQDERINCEGYFSLGNGKNLACSHIYGCGELDVVEALGRSCNIFFCSLGRRLGKGNFGKVAQGLPLGETVGTELAAFEGRGIAFVPGKYDKCNWELGDLANASIGQGAWIVTPMQLLVVTSAIVTGQRIQPHYVLGNVTQPLPMHWSDRARALVLAGMRACTEDAHGTGLQLQMDECAVLAKTGTAQAGNALPHAIIVAALPADNPRLAGVCVVEHVGSGGRYAAPLLKWAFQRALQMGYLNAETQSF
ncbi:MAG: hypothetical protein IJS08_02870 [Victivallales bacterium]|nr:hypothetical protein [Victivallales bacterium]